MKYSIANETDELMRHAKTEKSGYQNVEQTNEHTKKIQKIA